MHLPKCSTLRSLLHLSAWGQTGVLVRFYLGRLLGGTCSPTWKSVRCVTSPGITQPGGALFVDLPANILGCFIMGLLCTSDQLLMLGQGLHCKIEVTSDQHGAQQMAAAQLDRQAENTAMNSDGNPASSIQNAVRGPAHHAVSMPTSLQAADACEEASTEEAFLEAEAAAEIAATDAMPPVLQPRTLAAAQPAVQISAQCVEHTHNGHKVYISPGIPLAVLPPKSFLQLQPELIIGLRTGFCGCLTTFASWILQTVEMIVGRRPDQPAGDMMHTDWLSAVAGLLLGCLTCYSVLVLGQTLAAWAAHRHALAEADSRSENIIYSHVCGRQHHTDARDIELSSMDNHPPAIHSVNNKHISLQPPQAATECIQMYHDTPAHQSSDTRCCYQWWWCILPDVIPILMLAVLVGVSLSFIIKEGSGNTSITGWYAILLSPIGCLARWYLAAFNGGVQHPTWSWFPVGTWLANMIATLLDFIMHTLQLRVSISGRSNNLIAGVVSGVGGSLSTVSTWVVEIQKLHIVGWPRFTWAAQYLLATLLPSVALGVVVYGIPAWIYQRTP